MGASWVPGEADFPLREDHKWVQSGWFWNAKNQRVLSVKELLQKYDNTVGSNTNMLVGIVIDTSGQIPEKDRRIMKEFGQAIKRFKHPMVKTSGEGPVIEMALPNPQPINTVMIQEGIRMGQRVQSYEVEGLVSGVWKRLCSEKTIGHKRIQTFDPVWVSKVRLKITGKIAPVVIRNFSIYNMEE